MAVLPLFEQLSCHGFKPICSAPMWSSVMHTIAKIFSWFLVSSFTRVRHLYVSIIARRVGKAKGVFEDSEAVAGTGFAVCPNRVNGSPLPGGDFALCGVRGTCRVRGGDCGTRRGSCGTRRGSKKEGTPMFSLPL